MKTKTITQARAAFEVLDSCLLDYALIERSERCQFRAAMLGMMKLVRGAALSIENAEEIGDILSHQLSAYANHTAKYHNPVPGGDPAVSKSCKLLGMKKFHTELDGNGDGAGYWVAWLLYDVTISGYFPAHLCLAIVNDCLTVLKDEVPDHIFGIFFDTETLEMRNDDYLHL